MYRKANGFDDLEIFRVPPLPELTHVSDDASFDTIQFFFITFCSIFYHFEGI